MSSALWAVVLMKAPVLLLRSAGSDVCNGWLICQLVSMILCAVNVIEDYCLSYSGESYLLLLIFLMLFCDKNRKSKKIVKSAEKKFQTRKKRFWNKVPKHVRKQTSHKNGRSQDIWDRID